MDAANEKPKYSLWRNTAYMIALAWRTRPGVIWLCLLLSVLAVGQSLAELFVTPTVLQMIETRAPLVRLIWMIVAFAGLLLMVRGARGYLDSNTMLGRVSVRFRLVNAIHQKFMTTSYPNTEDQAVRKLLDRATGSVRGNGDATEAVWKTLTELLTNLGGFAVYLFLISSLDPALILVTLGATVASYLATKRINEWGYRHRAEEAEFDRRLSYVGARAEDYTLAKDVRLFGMRDWLLEVYEKVLRLYDDFNARKQRVYLAGDAIDAALSLLRNGVAYWYLIALTIREGLPASEFLLYFTAIGGFAAWVTGILGGLTTLHTQSLEISAVREFLEIPEPFLFDEGKPLAPEPGKPYEIALQNVSFRYPGAEKDTLTDISFTIRPGEKLAVVGLNGAGKTTLVKLICGFCDPTQGAVLLNGEDIRKFNRRDYYALFSAVFQQFSVLETTVRENVAQTSDGDEARLEDSLARAGIAEKVASLPGGADAHLGRKVYEDGAEFSGGEMQRLMLARALYKDAPIIVLDEPTAALDPIAESELYQRYGDLTGGRTSVYISHRLASTRFCDRIVLIADGGIAELGAHDDLMRAGGRYAELYEIQSRYYREGGAENEG